MTKQGEVNEIYSNLIKLKFLNTFSKKTKKNMKLYCNRIAIK